MPKELLVRDTATSVPGFTPFDPQLFVVTASDQSVINSTTNVNSALFLNLETNAVYTWESLLVYDGSTTGDFQIAFTWPTGASGWYCADSVLTPAATAMTTLFSGVSAGNLSLGALGVGTKQLIRVDGLIRTNGTGVLQHKFAQGTVDAANASTLYTNSYLAARRRA